MNSSCLHLRIAYIILKNFLEEKIMLFSFKKKIIFSCRKCKKTSEVDPKNFTWFGGGYSACMADGTYYCPLCKDSTLIYTGLGDNIKELFPNGLPKKYRK